MEMHYLLNRGVGFECESRRGGFSVVATILAAKLKSITVSKFHQDELTRPHRLMNKR